MSDLRASRLDADRLDADRLDADRLDADRLDADRLDADRLACPGDSHLPRSTVYGPWIGNSCVGRDEGS